MPLPGRLLIPTASKTDRLDRELAHRMDSIEQRAERAASWNRRTDLGVVALWHFVGEQLQFVDDPKIVHSEDRQEDQSLGGPLEPCGPPDSWKSEPQGRRSRS